MSLDGNDELLRLLTSSLDSPESLRESKWCQDYLTRLTSLPLDDLVREPDELRNEYDKVQRDAQQLAFHDYPAFIHADSCRKNVEASLDQLDMTTNDFLSALPKVQDAFDEFLAEAKVLAEDRGKLARVIEHHDVLVDLLEIPQLMETCVWNGYYTEAMDLASHVRLLLLRYPLQVVKSIEQQSQSSVDLMLVQLISHLRRPIKLAAAMNVIGHLRRMDAFASDTELRLVFLRCRHDYLEQRLQKIKVEPRQKGSEAFEYVKQYTDVMREQMFEIATYYMSVFSQQDQQSILILSEYMISVIKSMQDVLKEQLPLIQDTSSLASLLTQLQYCGMSLGRIGLDFRHLFVHMFEDVVRPLVLQWMDKATEDLVATISANAESPSKWMSAVKLSQTHHNNAYTKQHQPPMLLVDYPPLAIFTNAILSSLNALRLLPAVGLLNPIQTHLSACFLEIGNALKQYADQATERMPNESNVVCSFVAAYVRCCAPFLMSCLVDGIYNNVGQNDVSAVSVDDLEALLAAYLPKHDPIDQEQENTSDETQPVDTEQLEQDNPPSDNQPADTLETQDSTESSQLDTQDTSESTNENDKDTTK